MCYLPALMGVPQLARLSRHAVQRRVAEDGSHVAQRRVGEHEGGVGAHEVVEGDRQRLVEVKVHSGHPLQRSKIRGPPLAEDVHVHRRGAPPGGGGKAGGWSEAGGAFARAAREGASQRGRSSYTPRRGDGRARSTFSAHKASRPLVVKRPGSRRHETSPRRTCITTARRPATKWRSAGLRPAA